MPYKLVFKIVNITLTIITMRKLLIFAVLVAFFVTSAFQVNPKHASILENDIVDLAVQTDILSTLVAAVKAGDLVDVLKGDGPFTVFAPTNEAFAKLPAGTVENLLKPENKAQLVAVLTYHVVPGKVYSKDLKDGMKAKTAQGGELTISLKNGKAMVNNATVAAVDIEASNGVVHVIDTVILPPM
ncbi:putative surface protein with fasciclin (FAS1) repeats [Cecembia rubra]|uniref:Putative surface protein with fasciclin (FAS1) repeats n=2 Tax=Cecembia rubra TaxID=1485585 RepID=A0A2P8DPS9_9BACT|nr:putative surface protein with fasciclin (FAS1) repeats [Cecembia rubra]